MKSIVKRTLLATAVGAALTLGGAANAALFNPFDVVAPGNGGAGYAFSADKMTGNYNEVITFNGNGTFDVALYFSAGQFVTNAGQTPLNAKQTGLGSDYGVYALYTASGTMTTSGSATTFTFTPGSGSLAMYLDSNLDTDVMMPGTATGAFGRTSDSDDVLLASGDPLAGGGTLDPSLSTCSGSGGSGIDCGSFGSTTSFHLAPGGAAFFVSPNPFYDLSFQSGQLNIFSTRGTQMINGSLDVVFDTSTRPVPEPASLGLLGLGLLGLGLARRRKQA